MWECNYIGLIAAHSKYSYWNMEITSMHGCLVGTKIYGGPGAWCMFK